MQSKLLLTVLGVAVAGLTGAGSIYASIHPEKLAEARHFAETTMLGNKEETNTATNIEKSDQAEVDSQDDSNTGSASVHKEDNESDGGNGEEEDSESKSNTGSTQPPAVAPSTAKTFTMAQVSAHNTKTNCYTAINGSVYDLTPFINQHPGGVAAISSLCGIDGASAFQAQHGGQGRPEAELASLKVGVLAK